MNPSVELDALLTTVSYPQGDPSLSGGVFWAPLTQIYPTWNCTDLPSLDWALRVMSRVKTFTVTASYDTLVLTIVSANDGSYIKTSSAAGTGGTYSADYTSVLADETAALLSIGGASSRYAITAPRPLFGGCYFSVKGDTSGRTNYLGAALLRNATPTTGLPYILVLDLQVEFVTPMPSQGNYSQGDVQASAQGTGSLFSAKSPFDPPSQNQYFRSIPATFDGRPFSAGAFYTPPIPTSIDGTMDDSDTTAYTVTIYNTSGITVQASEYWSYDGKYDTSTGALVSS